MNTKNLIAPRASQRRNFAIQQGIQETLKATKAKEERQLLAEGVIQEAERNAKYSLVNSALERKLQQRQATAAVLEAFHYNYSKVMAGIFGATVYESLPLDDETKEADADEIVEEAANVFEALTETDQIIIANSPLFNDISTAVVKKVEPEQSKLSDEQIGDIAATLYHSKTKELSELSEMVKEKSAESLYHEQQIDKMKAEEDPKLQEDAYYMGRKYPKTLFRKINETKIERLTENVDLKGLKQSDIMNLALAETLFEYTILETIHTSRLAEITPAMVQHIVLK